MITALKGEEDEEEKAEKEVKIICASACARVCDCVNSLYSVHSLFLQTQLLLVLGEKA